jgi:hypothetical protein
VAFTLVGGTNTQVQYNSSGALAGSSNFTFKGTTATINTLNLTNALGVAYGGTNSTATPTAGAVPYGTGTAYAFTSAGTSGQALRSGGSGAPTFGTLGTGAGGTGLTTFSANQLFYASSSSVVGQSANLTFVNDNLSVNGITIGRGAGAVSTNTAAGSTALAANTTGNTNTAVGFAALNANTQGISNTAIGSSALIANTTGGNNTAVGRSAFTNSITGNSNTAVGSGSLFTADGASSNTAIGFYSLLSLETGSNNTAVGSGAGSSSISGSNNTILGYNAQASTTSVSNEITLGNSSVTTLRCQVTSITSLSDQRDKHSIEDLPVGLALINALRPRRYKWDKRDWYIDEVEREDGTTDYVPVPQDGSRAQDEWNEGFVAQEAKAALEAAGANWFPLVYETNPEKLEMSAGKLIPVLVKAIQELSARIEALEAK